MEIHSGVFPVKPPSSSATTTTTTTSSSAPAPSPSSSSSTASVIDQPAAPPNPNPPQTPAGPEPKKRVRRWHHRGFTGCSTCRRRHVRCDEASPSCKNCTRLGLECDGTQGRMTFKVYGPSQGPQESSASSSLTKAAPKKRGKKAAAAGPDKPPVIKKEEDEEEEEEEEGKDGIDAVVVSPTTVAESARAQYQFQDPFRMMVANPLDMRMRGTTRISSTRWPRCCSSTTTRSTSIRIAGISPNWRAIPRPWPVRCRRWGRCIWPIRRAVSSGSSISNRPWGRMEMWSRPFARDMHNLVINYD